MNQIVVPSPIGHLLISAQDGRLVQLRVLEAGEQPTLSGNSGDPVLDEAKRQLAQYFAGERKAFDLPLTLHGTAFEMAVWQQLRDIPFGKIMSYGELAERLGKPSASRAVGGACARNPLLVVVPCHRVVAALGKLTGFAAGMAAKRTLLAHEGWKIVDERVKGK